MNCSQGVFIFLNRRGFWSLRGEAAQVGVQRSQQRKMGGEAAIHVFGECFVIGVSGAVPVFEHGQPSGFIADPAVLVGEFETAFRRLAVEPFCPCPFLNDLPG